MKLSSRYNPGEVEKKWYTYWEEKNYFHSEPDDREPFTIIIPPPNVTGVLHMGHMLNNTIQDVLIRKARLDGKNACWVPGTDHASIATEAKVVRKLRARGIKKSDLTRDEFMEYAWQWTHEYGGIILEQLKRLGASCDWQRTAFTMDESRYDAVIKTFVDLYKKGKLYRGYRMVNWDPEAKTVLSNEEVLYSEENSKLYYVRYAIAEKENAYITIATTRPETILGDTAIAVHPEDARFKDYKDLKAVVPVVNREIPIIYDPYVDREFGTGALKITPAHDANDYDIGLKHNLEVIDVINDDGTISEAGQFYIGEDRLVARKRIVADMEASGNLVKVEDYIHNVGRSERTNVIIEPKLSLQWYVDMKKICDPALQAVLEGDIAFFPEKYVNTYRHWLENIRDWCISRQLWWGHRIPAYYYDDEVFVAETAEEALELARTQLNKPALKMEDLRQDEDVLDTWFSSWLWPISVFHGFRNRKELEYYYPTSVLVTGWDIIFLWVARMIMAGYEWENNMPFSHVYFTGMVRDKQRRKMSKSLGNSPDALKLIDDFGADAVRFGMLSCSPAGGDLLFDEKLIENGRNFSNKLWNGLRLVDGWKVDSNKSTPVTNDIAYAYIENAFNAMLEKTNRYYSEYRISDVLMSLYTFVWNDFFSWYLEMIKPPYGEPIDEPTYTRTLSVFEKICIVLHPFMPFITEELWHVMKDRNGGDDCIVAPYPKAQSTNDMLDAHMSMLKSIVSNVRDIRNKNQMKPKDPVRLHVICTSESNACFEWPGFEEAVKKMAYIEEIDFLDADKDVNGVAFITGKSKMYVELDKEIDLEEEVEKLSKELEYQKGFVNSVRKKLGNERFVKNAPAQVVEKERKKLADGLARIETIEASLERMGSDH